MTEPIPCPQKRPNGQLCGRAVVMLLGRDERPVCKVHAGSEHPKMLERGRQPNAPPQCGRCGSPKVHPLWDGRNESRVVVGYHCRNCRTNWR